VRRTKATLNDRRTKNLRAVQVLLGHSELESTVRYVGIEEDDALEISERTEIRSVRAGRPAAAPRRTDRTAQPMRHCVEPTRHPHDQPDLR